MMIYAANLSFDRSDNKSIAKTFFNYFLEQYADVTRRQVMCEAELASMRAANAEFNKHDDFGGGFSQDPYSHANIQYKEETLARIAEEVKDAHAIVIFLRDRFLEGVV